MARILLKAVVALACMAAVMPMAYGQPEILTLNFNGPAKTLSIAVSTESAVQTLGPLLERQLNGDENIEDAHIEMRIDHTQGSEIPLFAEVTGNYQYLPAFGLWTKITCQMEAVLHLTASTVQDAHIELTNPDGIAQSCSADGDGAAALGDAGKEAIKAVINQELGTTPWSMTVREILDTDDARAKTQQLLQIDTIPGDTSLSLSGCEVSGVAAVCAEIHLSQS